MGSVQPHLHCKVQLDGHYLWCLNLHFLPYGLQLPFSTTSLVCIFSDPKAEPCVVLVAPPTPDFYWRHCHQNIQLVRWTPHHHTRFTALFLWPPRWAGARRELLDFMVQGKINRGSHTDHLAGHHSIRTNQCPLPPYPCTEHCHQKFVSTPALLGDGWWIWPWSMTWTVLWKFKSW